MFENMWLKFFSSTDNSIDHLCSTGPGEMSKTDIYYLIMSKYSLSSDGLYSRYLFDKVYSALINLS